MEPKNTQQLVAAMRLLHLGEWPDLTGEEFVALHRAVIEASAAVLADPDALVEVGRMVAPRPDDAAPRPDCYALRCYAVTTIKLLASRLRLELDRRRAGYLAASGRLN